MPKITKRTVDEAKPRDVSFFVWCSELSGFGVRIHPTGRRTYYADYRNRDGARKRIKIGDHGKVTTEEARKLALALLGGVVRGEDPAAERVTRRDATTIAGLCVAYMQAVESGAPFGKRRQPKKASTIAQDHARINRHIVPLLGSKLVRDLTRADVARFIRDVTSGKTATVEKTGLRGKAIVKGGAGTAARAANFLGAILQWAIQEEMVESNPAHGVKRQADRKRTRRLTPDEYGRLGEAIRDAADAGPWQGVDGLRLLALTGCRLGEVVNLRWDEVDAAGSALRLEDSKEGASTRPIGRAALDVLASLPRQDDSPFVLPGVRGTGPYGGLSGFAERAFERAGLEGVTCHTLRHSFASTAADLGYVESTIAAMIGHTIGSVTGRYTHHLDGVLIAAADRVAGEIDAAMKFSKRLGV